MKISKYWSYAFYLVAVLNILGTLPGILNPASGYLEFTGIESSDYYDLFFFRSLWIIVLLFGVGYFIVARNPEKNHAMLLVGGIGKLIFAIHVILAFLDDKVTGMALTAGIADLVWVAVFVVFLFKFGRK